MWSVIGQWLAGALSGPAANLLSGLIGAVIGVVGLFLIQGLQTRASKREAQSAARLIYLEIGFNIAALQSMAASTASVPLIVGRGEWDRQSFRLATIMPEHEIARVAQPYIQLDAYRLLFSQPWYYMAVTRFQGDDIESLKKLSDAFREAEAALRPLVWTGPRLTGLTEAMQVRGNPFAPRSMYRRLRAASSDVPMGFLVTLTSALLGMRLLLWVMKTIRGWFGADRS